MNQEKTVYFLGAGASNASHGLPTMKGFFGACDLSKDKYSELSNFIEKNYPQIPVEELNLEDVITGLDIGRDRFGSFGKRPRASLDEARYQLHRYIRYRLDYELQNKEDPRSVYRRIFLTLEDGDTIATLNYDLIVDDVLQGPGKGSLGKTAGGRDRFLWVRKLKELLSPVILWSGEIVVPVRDIEWQHGWYLKLHGSINWIHCPNQECMYHQWINMHPMEEVRLFEDGKFCSSCGSPIEVAIVPPSMFKILERYPKVGVLWSIARRELSEANKVVFIGVSFAASDYYLRWLIKSSFLETRNPKKLVILVDECKSVGERLKEMINLDPVLYPDIDAYISEQVE